MQFRFLKEARAKIGQDFRFFLWNVPDYYSG